MKKLLLASVLACSTMLSSCSREADIASENLSRSADEFQITRRIVFYNGITDTYLLEIRGLCSLGNKDAAREVTVTCKTGPKEYKKHFLGLSDNVTYFAEQIDSADVSGKNYKVIFKPASILPDIEIK